MQRGELVLGLGHPIGVGQVVKLVEVDRRRPPLARAIACASVDFPLFDGPMMQMRVPSASSSIAAFP